MNNTYQIIPKQSNNHQINRHIVNIHCEYKQIYCETPESSRMRRESMSLVDKWKQRVEEYDSAIARTRDMNKLFYIHHHKVNEIIRDPIKSSDPALVLQTTQQINRIIKATENNKDPFIQSLIRDNSIKGFKQSFQDLLVMLNTTAKLNKQKDVVENLIKKRAFSATLLKDDKKQNNIHQEIKISSKRMKSIKAGKPLSIIINPTQPRNLKDTTNLTPSQTYNDTINLQQQFRLKKQDLESMMSTFIMRKSATDFKIVGKNYQLQEYFNKRKQLTNLYLGSKTATPVQTPNRQVSFSQDQQEEPHFMTELGVDVNKVKKPLVKKNVERIIEIVNQKLIEDRKGREIQKYHKIKEVEFNRLAEIQAEAFNDGKKRERIRQRERAREKEMKAEFELEQREKDNKIMMMSTFRTSASLGRKLYIQNTPLYGNGWYEDQRRMARKLSSRMF